MPLPTRALALCVLVALAGCDSTGSNRDLQAIDGVYSVAELSFDPSAPALPDANVAARLDAARTNLEVFGSPSSNSLLRVRFTDDTATERVDLRATASRGRVTFEAVTASDESALRRLFLPRSFSLDYDASRPRDLSAQIQRTGVDLAAFDPVLYQGLPPVNGTLRVRFTPSAGN